MTIDRHNYEEFFLLYVDNELSVEQKKQVDQFVEAHPDLWEELVMFLQAKLVPDHSFEFAGKDALLKKDGDQAISLDNYEEWLVLYADNELKEDERLAVEKFAAANPNVQRDLDLFLQTKLVHEEIVFPNKESLYRKEKVAVISMAWWRVAVAAVLVIGGGITLYTVVNTAGSHNSTKPAIAKTTNKSKPVSINPNPSESKKTILPIKNEKEIARATQSEEPAKLNAVKREVKKSAQQENENTRELVSLPVENNSQKSRVKATEELTTSVAATLPMGKALVNNENKHTEIINTVPVTIDPTQSPNKVDVPNDVASNTENKKLRGFFRKATRIIQRTTNINPANDDNKVLIGGMAINLK